MSSETNSTSTAPLDAIVSRNLASRYGNLSRRSFLSGLTRKLIGLAGVSLAAEIFPYLASPAFADAPGGAGPNCGLHGNPCQGGCMGGSAAASWQQCCKVNCCYQCCTYTDFCNPPNTLPPPGWPHNCTGTASGTLWCRPPTLTLYICTMTACSGAYTTLSSCTSGCAPSCSI